MKEGIHPNYFKANVECACGEKAVIGASVGKISVDVCSNCHPFYTGQSRMLDIEGRVERFNRRFNVQVGQTKK